MKKMSIEKQVHFSMLMSINFLQLKNAQKKYKAALEKCLKFNI
jgi:hypothetical protein